MSKRYNPYGTTSTIQQNGLSKRRRPNSYQMMPRGVNQQQIQTYQKPYRLFTPRTPGGNVTSERKYFDSQVDATTIVQAATTWAGLTLVRLSEHV